MPRRGFTLIELLVVIAVMGAVMALVGPFGAEQLSRSQRIAELKQVEDLLQQQSQRAFFRGTVITLQFDGKMLSIQPGEQQMNFEQLFFLPQQLVINKTGAYSATLLNVQAGRRVLELKLPSLSDGYAAQ